MRLVRRHVDDEVVFLPSSHSSATMILFANVAYHEMRGVVMGACETIAGLTRCIVLSHSRLKRRALCSFLHCTAGHASRSRTDW